MIKRLFIPLFLFLTIFSFGQNQNENYAWWNDLSYWEPGDPGWRNWMIVAPGYLGQMLCLCPN
ncbi:MAG: hypothetical protein R2757_12265 [Draconibacterium sp.]